MNSGSRGADPSGLTINEYDGYLILDDREHPIHLAWHVLPRKAANVEGNQALSLSSDGIAKVPLTNTGVGTAQLESFALLATSDNIPRGGMGMLMPTPDIRAVGINTYPVQAGFCSDQESFIWAFAINTWERQQHIFDFIVFNGARISFFLNDGRQLTWALNLATGDFKAFFFAQHSMNTGNTVLSICAEQVGLTGSDMLSRNVDMQVEAFDWYNFGPGDRVPSSGVLTVTPYGEQYYAFTEDIEPGVSKKVQTVVDSGLFPGNTPEKGLLIFTNSDRGYGRYGGATQATETFFLTAPGVADPNTCGSLNAGRCDKTPFCSWDPDDRLCLGTSSMVRNLRGNDPKADSEARRAAAAAARRLLPAATMPGFHPKGGDLKQ